MAELQAELRLGINPGGVSCLGRTVLEVRCKRPISRIARRSAREDIKVYQRSAIGVHPSTKYEQLREVISHCTCTNHQAMSAEILETMWRQERDTWSKVDDGERAECDTKSKPSATTKVQSAEPGCEHKAKRKPTVGGYLDCEICKLELLTDEDLDERRQAVESSKEKIDKSRWMKLAWCKTGCGRNYHAECWTQWLAVLTEKRAIPRELACPYCQAHWDFRQCGCEQEVKFE